MIGPVGLMLVCWQVLNVQYQLLYDNILHFEHQI